jgi:streptogramin lyase
VRLLALVALALCATATAGGGGTAQGPSIVSSEGFEPKIAVGRDALWISDAVRHSVVRVDPRRLRITSVVSHGNGVAALGAQVWSTDGSLAWRISGGSVRRLKTGSGPFHVTAGGGAVWLANRFAKTVAKVDPVHARVVATLHVPERPSALAYGAGRLTVALF